MSAAETRDLSIILGAYNRLEPLKRLLASVVGKVRHSHEIVVIDAGSTDGTQEYLRSRTDIVPIFDGQRIGLSRSYNRVFPTLKGKYICWLADDAEVEKGGLDAAVDVLEARPEIGMISMKMRDVAGPWSGEPYTGGIWPSGILTCNLGMIRRDVLEQVGFFSEEFRFYYDPDLTAKVLLAGHSVAVTKRVVVKHYRDYMEFKGALEDSERDEALLEAKRVYRRKFEGVLPFRSPLVGRLVHWTGSAMRRLIRWTLLPAWWLRSRGYNDRDVYNVVAGRYISWSDLSRHREDDFYLVQSISGLPQREERLRPAVSPIPSSPGDPRRSSLQDR